MWGKQSARLPDKRINGRPKNLPKGTSDRPAAVSSRIALSACPNAPIPPNYFQTALGNNIEAV